VATHFNENKNFY
jgi:hypothetical protein